MESESAPTSAAEQQRGKWIAAAFLGGVVLAYAGYGLLLYQVVLTIF
jgi:hypothetical protein